MGTAHLNGPHPDITHDACVVCVMIAKGEQWNRAAEQIEEVQASKDDTPKYFPWPAELDKWIRPAVYVALWSEAPQLGMLRLCWDHVAAAGADRRQSRLFSGNAVPPGLLRGRG